MRSWRELAAAGLLTAVLAACGNDHAAPDDHQAEQDLCQTSYLHYANFGEPFVVNWCRGCHGSAVPQAMRQKAPLDINFDTFDDVLQWKDRIALRAGQDQTMPPAGGPSNEERILLVEWLQCGAPN